MSRRDFAISLINKGFYVFPVNGKKPDIPDWPNQATNNEDDIWDNEWFNYNITEVRRPEIVDDLELGQKKIMIRVPKNLGILTGYRSGLLIIDIESKEDDAGFTGFDYFKDLENEWGELPETLTVRTGSNGLHYYFKYPENVRIRTLIKEVASQIDILADNGFVVSFESTHPDTGKKYEILNDREIAELSDEWVEGILNVQKEVKTRNTKKIKEAISSYDGKHTSEAVHEYVERIEPAGTNLFYLIYFGLCNKLGIPLEDSQPEVERYGGYFASIGKNVYEIYENQFGWAAEKKRMNNIKLFDVNKDEEADPAPNESQYNIEEGEYLDNIDIKITSGKVTMVVAPTGIGKTTWAYNKYKDDKLFMVFPTISQVKQKEQDWNVHGIYGGTHPNGDRVQIGTYDSIKKFLPCKDCNEYTLVVDECHNLVTAMGYRSKALKTVKKAFPEFKQVILLTATPVNTIEDGDDERIDISQTNEKQEMVFVTCKDRYSSIKDRISKGKFNLIFHDNKKDGEELKEYFKNHGYNAITINKDTSQEEAHQLIINESTIPEDVDIIIATQYIAESINIEKVNLENIIFYQPTSPVLVRQMVSRFRDSEPEKVYILFSDKDFNFELKFNYQKCIDYLYQSTIKICKALNKAKDYNNPYSKHSVKEDDLYYFDTRTREYKPDLLNISFKAYNISFAYMCRNPLLYRDALEELNFKLVDLENDTKVALPEDKAERERIKKKLKTSKEEEIRRHLKYLDKAYAKDPHFQPNPNSWLEKRYSDLRWHLGADETEMIHNILIDIQDSVPKFKTVLTQIDCERIMDYMDGQIIGLKYLKSDEQKMYSKLLGIFKIDQSYTSEEILDIFGEVSEELNIMKPKNIKAANKILKNLFILQYSSKSGKNAYKIIGRYPLNKYRNLKKKKKLR